MNYYDKMNEYLANQQVMYMKLHNIHWYIKGTSFFTLHQKTEELYNTTAEMIDEIAERLLALGCNPVSSLKKAISIASVEELTDESITCDKAMHHLITDMQYWIKDTEDLIRLAEDECDIVSADMFTGYLKGYEKNLWMLRSYMEIKV